MPELPEVETVVRDLRPLIVGRTIRSVRNGKFKLRRPWDPAWNAGLAGLAIEGLRRRGKWIVADLPGPRLILHLGMTGQLTAVDAAEPEPDHLHLVFALDGGRELRFRDPRRFGSVTQSPDEAAVQAFFASDRLGPEPFDLDPEEFRRAVRGTARNLKALLLDQRIVAGVGNIYADEVCFRARLDPRRKGKSLTAAEVDRLRESIAAVLTRAIDRRGSTIRDYVGGSGLRGGFQEEFAVYGRTDEPCLKCGTAIAFVRLAGRASHFCPACQKKSKAQNKSGQTREQKKRE